MDYYSLLGLAMVLARPSRSIVDCSYMVSSIPYFFLCFVPSAPRGLNPPFPKPSIASSSFASSSYSSTIFATLCPSVPHREQVECSLAFFAVSPPPCFPVNCSAALIRSGPLFESGARFVALPGVLVDTSEVDVFQNVVSITFGSPFQRLYTGDP